MGFGFSPMRRVREEEWMDGPEVPAEELSKALSYIRWINRVLKYNAATIGRVEAWSKEWTKEQAVSLLDVATGSGDVPVELLRWNGGRYRLQVVGLDFHPVTIGEARDIYRGPGYSVVQGDAVRLPFADGSVDYVMTSMFLHHLSQEQSVAVLREMWRVARRGVLAADLIRSRRAYAGVWALSRFSSAMIRHDATVSVRQAFTMAEMEAMAREAGWLGVEVRRHRNYRFTAVAGKG